jgi:hypothetical protein
MFADELDRIDSGYRSLGSRFAVSLRNPEDDYSEDRHFKWWKSPKILRALRANADRFDDVEPGAALWHQKESERLRRDYERFGRAVDMAISGSYLTSDEIEFIDDLWRRCKSDRLETLLEICRKRTWDPSVNVDVVESHLRRRLAVPFIDYSVMRRAAIIQ